MPIYGLPESQTNPEFTIAKFKLLMPRFKDFVTAEDGSQVYDIFKEIANDQILINTFGAKWEYAMSLAIAHYLDMNNYDRESSYSLHESKKDSGMKKIIVSENLGENQSRSYSTDEITVTSNYAKFWNTTEYGRRLITLLESQGVPTLFVVS